MGDKSKIEWTDATWNPTTGCSRVSSGCDNCYAMTMAKRIQAMGTTDAYDGTTRDTKRGVDWTGVVNLHPDRLDQPIRWKRPRMIFVNSMSDLFHPVVPFSFVDQVFAAMALAPQHIFQVLTKRPERMAEYTLGGPRWMRVIGEMQREGVNGWATNIFGSGRDRHRVWLENHAPSWPLPNVWLGTSIEHQEAADERVPHLLRCPAAVRFLSAEPLIGPIDFYYSSDAWYEAGYTPWRNVPIMTGIHWVIIGGESGPGARPLNIEWVREIVGQCGIPDVAVFVKQLGAHPCDLNGAYFNLRDRKGGDMAEWPEDLRVREMPETAVPA